MQRASRARELGEAMADETEAVVMTDEVAAKAAQRAAAALTRCESMKHC